MVSRAPWILALLIAPAAAQAQAADDVSSVPPQLPTADAAVRRTALELLAVSREMAFNRDEFSAASADEGAAQSNWTRTLNPAAAVALKRLSPQTVEIRSPELGYSARVNFAAGDELFRPGIHLLTGSLTPGDSWRREVDLSFEASGLDTVGLTVTAGAFSGRQPILIGLGIRHGVGELTRWQESNTWDMGLKLQSPDSRFRYSGGVSWSRYSLGVGSQLDRQDGFLLNRPQWKSAFSWWQKVEADLWKSDQSSASAYVVSGVMDETYRTLQSRSDSPLLFNGETFAAGGALSEGKTQVSLSYSATDGAEFSQREATGRLRRGVFDLTMVSGGWTFRDAEFESWSLTNRFWRGKARVSLSGVFGAKSGTGFLPEAVNFRVNRTENSNSILGVQASSLRTALGFGLSWSRDGSNTDIGFSRTITSRPGSPMRNPSSGEEYALDFNQSFSADWWDLSLYGSAIIGDAADSSDRLLSGGLAFSINGKRWPKVSVGLDVNSLDMSISDYRLRDQGISVNASVDLSKYLPVSDAESKPYLKIKAYGDWSRSGDSYSAYETRLEPTVALVFGTRF